MNGSKHLPYKAFLPYLDDGGKLYFTILPSDTLTVDGTLIFYITHNLIQYKHNLCIVQYLASPIYKKFNCKGLLSTIYAVRIISD